VGRRPIVERSVALDRVLARFWKTGFEATSIDDLLAASGMHRGSFYRAFVDKDHAFREALGRYIERATVEDVLPAVGGRGSPVRRLRRLMMARLDVALGLSGGAAGDGPVGCLVVNTAIEVAPHDPAVGDVVAAALDGVRRAIAHLVAEAVEAGEVDAGVDVELAAEQLFVLLQGANVLARAGSPRRDLRRLVDRSLVTMLRPTGAGEPDEPDEPDERDEPDQPDQTDQIDQPEVRGP
jgi:TetR/AcrR family transcriptional regulator, transcriptional repressor for nem operon